MKFKTFYCTSMTRKFTLTLAPEAGAINMFYAFLNGNRIIADEGTETRSWEGEIDTAEVRIKVRVMGIDDAQYTATFNLPGTAEDQSLTFILTGGYHEFELRV